MRAGAPPLPEITPHSLRRTWATFAAMVVTPACEVIDDDIAGIAVHIAARVSAHAGPAEVLVSRTVRDLVTGSGIAIQARGERELRGAPGTWELFAVGSETAPLPAPDQTRNLRASDRVVLLAARRAPRLLRAASRIGTRHDRPQAREARTKLKPGPNERPLRSPEIRQEHVPLQVSSRTRACRALRRSIV